VSAFWCNRIELFELLGEVAGFKAGLALSRNEIRDHLPDCLELAGNDDERIRIRFEELETIVRDLLFALGTLKRRTILNPAMELHVKYHRNARKAKILRCITDELIAGVEKRIRDAVALGPIDITPIAERLATEYGAAGLKMFDEFEELLKEHMQGNITSNYRHTEWKNVEDLAALFRDESLSPAHGVFLDQRFIDYLQRNTDALDAMNWRKFEGLTGEFFAREGYRVAIGKGRADGGIDLRVWRESVSEGTPPTILIQCKRQKKKVGQIIVKALWADVLNEQAESGLIVTTSALQPSASTVCAARGYPIQSVDRSTLCTWLEKLRTPGTGVFR